jgi:hypothetical protein
MHLIWYIFRAIDTHKQVHHQQIALILEHKTLVHILATVHSCLQGVSVFKDIYSIIVQLVNNSILAFYQLLLISSICILTTDTP